MPWAFEQSEGAKIDEEDEKTEEAFSCHDHTHPRLSLQVQLLLELRGRIPENDHRDSRGDRRMVARF